MAIATLFVTIVYLIIWQISINKRKEDNDDNNTSSDSNTCSGMEEWLEDNEQ